MILSRSGTLNEEEEEEDDDDDDELIFTIVE